MSRVVRIKDNIPGAIRVDRKTVWGNPYIMRDESDRETVCNLFEHYAIERLKKEPAWLEPLLGKDLACWCVPLRCHAETLLKLANQPQP